MAFLKTFYVLMFILLANATSGSGQGFDQAPLSGGGSTCKHHLYTIHLFSKAPLVIYISNFLTSEESFHLQNISEGTFVQSGVVDESGAQGLRTSRTSQSTVVPRDAIVHCIETRALSFQGFDIPRTHLEPLQLVKYGRGETYEHHTDWFSDVEQITAAVGGNRLSSFFVYVAANNVTGGGTNFPILDAPRDKRWCEFLDCDEPLEKGVTFRPVPGNAIFWQNLNENGSGDPATTHAGLPVTSGMKLGMNIWTRQGPLSNFGHRKS